MCQKRLRKIGIIGFGNMGSSIAERIKSKYEVWVFDKDKNKTNNIKGIKVAIDSIDLVETVDTLILAVKPQDFDAVLSKIKNYVAGKLIVSIAAGITTGFIEKFLGKIRVIRVMPNIGAKIGEAETSLCKGAFATDKDLLFIQEIFNYLGKTWIVEEKMLNPATAISGSGLAYIYYDIEANNFDPYNIPEAKKQDYIKRLAEAARKLDFNAKDAYDLAVSTTSTSINLIKKTGLSVSELRKQITSPGGTTEAALEVLKSGGSWEEAAVAALKRAEELSRG